MRLIDADKLKYKHQVNYSDTTRPYTLNCISFDEIQKAPTIQAVPIEVLDKIKEDIWLSRKNTCDKAEIVNLIDKMERSSKYGLSEHI